MKKWLLALAAACCSLLLNAQLLTWTPPFPKENDPAQTLVITVDATKGNQGLLNYTPTTDVYVHIGVITNQSTGSGDWRHVPFTWGSTNASANAVYLGANKWKFTITGSLRTFFNITDPAETIQKIAILFRNGNGNSAQRNGDGSDMYVPVYGNNFRVRIDQPASQPKYAATPEIQTWVVGTSFTITANASATANLKLYHNGTQIASAPGAQTISGTSTVSAVGNQQLVAEANNGTSSVFDTLNIFVSPASSPTAALPAGTRDGINYEQGDSTATLVLRAPNKSKAVVIGDFNNWTQDASYLMNKTPDGKFFWLRLHNLTAGTEYGYQYIVDDTIRVADPYTEKVLDPNNDPSIPASTYPNLKPYPSGKTTGIVSVLQTATPSYNWTAGTFARPDKRGLVIYELLVRDFVAAHDWKTVRDSLNYLKGLGINAIEIMPFNEFEGNDSWGYNPDFYFAPDKYYGPKNTLKEFIDSCHKRGIAVIMDMVLNHSFGSSPMVQLYWDPANNRPATNSPWFNPVPKHAFNVGFDINHESTDTKYFVGRVVEHWLQQYQLDGFRFDLSKGFTQNQTCDNTGNNCNVNAFGAYDASRVAIWKGYYDTVQNKSNGSYVILEHFADNTEEKELADYGMMLWGNSNANYSQAAMGWDTPDPGGNLPDFSGNIYSSPARGWTKPHLVTYMESHDEERIVYKNLQFGKGSPDSTYKVRDTTTALKRMELAASFFFTIPAPKMLWQFGELGYPYSINTCSNGTIDNSCRLADKPIRWDYLADPRRKHVHDVYSSLISLRFHPWYKNTFITGNISYSFTNTFKWIKVTSANDTSDLVVIGNFDVIPQTGNVAFPTAGTWYDYLGGGTVTTTGTAQNFTLQPGEYRVYANRNLNNTTATPVSNVQAAANHLQVAVYPNPVQNTFEADLNIPQSGTVTIDLYNQLGQHVTSLYSGFLSRGVHELFLKKPIAAGGNYYLKVATNTASATMHINLQ
jgi:1,4-alpha-glucan branching enzyme